LDGSRGKPPPVLTARLGNSYSFPLDFQLTALDLTAEGRGATATATATATAGGEDASSTKEEVEYWWNDLDLIVSARWDTDGIAATRDPSDLVGRGFASSKARRAATSRDGGGGGSSYRCKGVGLRGNLLLVSRIRRDVTLMVPHIEYEGGGITRLRLVMFIHAHDCV